MQPYKRIVFIVVVLTMALAACQPAPTPAPTAPPAAPPAAPAAPTAAQPAAPQPTAVPPTAPKPTATQPPKELVILAEDIPAGLDSDGPSIAIPTSQTGIANVYDVMVAFKTAPNADGVLVPDFTKFEGRLAESWEVDSSGTVWTFHLRKGVKSCAGNEFTADDVVYTFARGKTVSGASPINWFLSNVAAILPIDSVKEGATAEDKKLKDEVTKIDDYTVRIKQSEKNALILPVLGNSVGLAIFDSKEAKKHATTDDPWSHQWLDVVGAAGFSPFCIERWVKDQEFVVTANPNYYRGIANVARVIYRKVPSDANRVAAIQTGAADVVEHLTAKEFADLKGKPGVKVQGLYGNENLFIHMNFKSPPWNNIKFRQAVAYAMPYDSIIKAAYYGEAKRWYSVIPSAYPGYAEFKVYDYNLDKAKQLLAEAGFPEGKGLEKYADAMQLFFVAEKQGFLGPVANIIQTELAKIGVKVALNPIPQTQYGDRQIVKRDLPFALNDQEKPIVADGGYAQQLFFVSVKNGGLNNMVNYDNPTIDDLYSKVRVELDTAKRNELLKQMQQIEMEQVAWLPVVEWKTQVAMRENVTGYTWFSDNSLRWYTFDKK